MSKLIDLTNQEFGRLVVTAISPTRSSEGRVQWVCNCTCGTICTVRSVDLRSGHTRSCGCLLRDTHTVHGMSSTPEYMAWKKMLARCNDPSNPYYHRYGGRGIKVCERWGQLDNFYADMGDRPSENHSLDRIDNNGDYCKENCKWSTRSEQQNNKGCTRSLTHNGVTMTISQWAALLGTTRPTLFSRKRNGWSDEETVTTPIARKPSRGSGEPK